MNINGLIVAGTSGDTGNTNTWYSNQFASWNPASIMINTFDN